MYTSDEGLNNFITEFVAKGVRKDEAAERRIATEQQKAAEWARMQKMRQVNEEMAHDLRVLRANYLEQEEAGKRKQQAANDEIVRLNEQLKEARTERDAGKQAVANAVRLYHGYVADTKAIYQKEKEDWLIENGYDASDNGT
jgi:hypothetical protein